MKNYHNLDLKRNMLKYINDISDTNDAFINNVKFILSVKELCVILKINRNRYNYLVRNNQLHIEILTLRGGE